MIAYDVFILVHHIVFLALNSKVLVILSEAKDLHFRAFAQIYLLN